MCMCDFPQSFLMIFIDYCLHRAVNNPQMNVKLHFVQWTVQNTSEQSFAIYKGRKSSGGIYSSEAAKKKDTWSVQQQDFSKLNLITGDPEKPIKV
jgi:hypothetical protein